MFRYTKVVEVLAEGRVLIISISDGDIEELPCLPRRLTFVLQSQVSIITLNMYMAPSMVLLPFQWINLVIY